MPFAWTGIHLHSILHGAGAGNDREKEKASDAISNDPVLLSGANSLGNIRKACFLLIASFYHISVP